MPVGLVPPFPCLFWIATVSTPPLHVTPQRSLLLDSFSCALPVRGNSAVLTSSAYHWQASFMPAHVVQLSLHAHILSCLWASVFFCFLFGNCLVTLFVSTEVQVVKKKRACVLLAPSDHLPPRDGLQSLRRRQLEHLIEHWELMRFTITENSSPLCVCF